MVPSCVAPPGGIKRPRRLADLLSLFALVVLTVALALRGPVTHRMMRKGDHPKHLEIAEKLVTTGKIRRPHFAYHALVIGVRSLIRCSSHWLRS